MANTKGLFKTDKTRSKGGQIWQVASRFIYEPLQTLLGYVSAQTRNIFHCVDRVDYYGGATFVTNEQGKEEWGFSLGSFINTNIKGTIEKPFDEYITKSNPMYMHEYGHYIQSQMLGPLYAVPAIYSGWHTLINKGRTMTYNYWSGIPVSSDHWTETWANRLAAKYFGENEGVDWERDRFRNGNRILPLHIYYPLESFF